MDNIFITLGANIDKAQLAVLGVESDYLRASEKADSRLGMCEKEFGVPMTHFRIFNPVGKSHTLFGNEIRDWLMELGIERDTAAAGVRAIAKALGKVFRARGHN